MTLKDEIRQTRAFGSLEQEAYLNLVRTAAMLSEGVERALKPAGLTASQYNVLRILNGTNEEGLCRNDVRDRMLTRMPDMTRLLDRMESSGLVARARGTEDRRVVKTHITDAGRAALRKIEDAIAAEHKRSLGHLSRAELNTFIELLDAARRTTTCE